MKTMKIQEALYSITLQEPEIKILTMALDILYNETTERRQREAGLCTPLVFAMLNELRVLRRQND